MTKYCSWPLDNGQDCGKPLEDGQHYCPEHEQEARAWDEDIQDIVRIVREWRAYRLAGDETPPWKGKQHG